MRVTVLRHVLIAAMALLASPVPGVAQQSASTTSRPITPADIKAWNSIRQTVLSNDGTWFAYVVSPAEGNATVVVQRASGEGAATRIPVGENGGSITISGDSRWLGYIVAPNWVDSSARRGAGRGAAGGNAARGGGAPAQSPDSARAGANKFVLMNLASGERKEFERIRRFQFNADTASWVALVGYPAGSGGTGGASPAAGRGGGRGGGGGGGGVNSAGGANVMIYNVQTGEQFNLGVIDEFAFDDQGEWLAWTMDTPDQVGSGVQLKNLRSSITKSIDSERMVYSHLAWLDDSRTLTVMRGRIDEARRDTVFTLVAFADFGPTGPARRLTFDPADRSDFPADWKIASERAPRYAEDLSAVFFGIREGVKQPARGQRVEAGAQDVEGFADGRAELGVVGPLVGQGAPMTGVVAVGSLEPFRFDRGLVVVGAEAGEGDTAFVSAATCAGDVHQDAEDPRLE
jgi:hypothetical protein